MARPGDCWGHGPAWPGSAFWEGPNGEKDGPSSGYPGRHVVSLVLVVRRLDCLLSARGSFTLLALGMVGARIWAAGCCCCD